LDAQTLERFHSGHAGAPLSSCLRLIPVIA